MKRVLAAFFFVGCVWYVANYRSTQEAVVLVAALAAFCWVALDDYKETMGRAHRSLLRRLGFIDE